MEVTRQKLKESFELWQAAQEVQPNPFLHEDHSYDDIIRRCIENGITGGTTATTFSPNTKCDRSQIVTFLWTADGNEIVDSANPFTDVAEGKWYYNAVMWAVENGITNGIYHFFGIICMLFAKVLQTLQ